MAPSTLPNRLVTVFQAANEDRREVYFGVTDLLMERVLEEMEKAHPAAIAHWASGERVGVRGIVYAIPAAQAYPFIVGLGQALALSGWTVLGDGPAG